MDAKDARGIGSVSLEPKLQAVLARLCKQLGPLLKTRAVKLPYLVDVVSSHVLGEPVTEGKHQTWEHGVVSKQVYTFITHSDGNELLRVEPHSFSESGQLVRLVGAPEEILSGEEKEIVDYVAEQYGRLSAVDLGRLTKFLNTEIEPEYWGQNVDAKVDDDAYARLSTGWLEFSARLPGFDLDDRTHWSGTWEGGALENLTQLANG